jgi:hypothetical protein
MYLATVRNFEVISITVNVTKMCRPTGESCVPKRNTQFYGYTFLVPADISGGLQLDAVISSIC